MKDNKELVFTIPDLTKPSLNGTVYPPDVIKDGEIAVKFGACDPTKEIDDRPSVMGKIKGNRLTVTYDRNSVFGKKMDNALKSQAVPFGVGSCKARPDGIQEVQDYKLEHFSVVPTEQSAYADQDL